MTVGEFKYFIALMLTLNVVKSVNVSDLIKSKILIKTCEIFSNWLDQNKEFFWIFQSEENPLKYHKKYQDS